MATKGRARLKQQGEVKEMAFAQIYFLGEI
jgi:hypothetical protein